jgi:hypothetical protein
VNDDNRKLYEGIRDRVYAGSQLNESELRGHGKDWWESPEKVKATEAMLLRAGVFSDGDTQAAIRYYRSKPWKWTRERSIARLLERTWETTGIPVEEAWEMTGQEVMARMQERDAKRGLR